MGRVQYCSSGRMEPFQLLQNLSSSQKQKTCQQGQVTVYRRPVQYTLLYQLLLRVWEEISWKLDRNRSHLINANSFPFPRQTQTKTYRVVYISCATAPSTTITKVVIMVVLVAREGKFRKPLYAVRGETSCKSQLKVVQRCGRKRARDRRRCSGIPEKNSSLLTSYIGLGQVLLHYGIHVSTFLAFGVRTKVVIMYEASARNQI